MHLKTGKLTLEELFLTILSCFIIVEILDSSLLNIARFETLFKWFTLGFLFLLYLIDVTHYKKKLRILFLELIVIISAFVSFRITNRAVILMAILFSVCSRKVDFRKICKCHMLSVLAALGILGMLILTGVLNDYIYKGAHCFGFSYFHQVPYHLYFCFLDYLFLKKNKMPFWEVIIWLVLNYWLFLMTTITLVFILVIITIVLYYIIKKYPIINIASEGMAKLSYLLYPVGIAVIFVFIRFYDARNAIWQQLNTFSRERIRFVQEAYYRYNINLFGNKIISNTGTVDDSMGYLVRRRTGAYFYLDSGFAYSLISYGLIFTALMIFLYTCITLYSCRKNEKIIFVWAVTVMFFTISNNIWLNITYNPLLLLSFPAVNYLFSFRKKRPRHNV